MRGVLASSAHLADDRPLGVYGTGCVRGEASDAFDCVDFGDAWGVECCLAGDRSSSVYGLVTGLCPLRPQRTLLVRPFRREGDGHGWIAHRRDATSADRLLGTRTPPTACRDARMGVGAGAGVILIS